MKANRFNQTVSTAALLAVALAVGPAIGQVQVQGGAELDANQQVGSGGYNQAGQRVDYQSRNLLITGNVGGGRAFQGAVDYSADGSFLGTLDSDALFNFRRDSVFSAPGTGGLNYGARDLGDRVIITRPSDSVAGFRVNTGTGLTTRAAYDPSAGVVTFRQNGGGLVAIAGIDSPERFRGTRNSLGLIQTPQGLVNIDASPLTGIRYNPLDASVPTLGPNLRPQQQETENQPEQPETEVDPETGEVREVEPEGSLRQSLRVDGTYRPGQPLDQVPVELREDPLAITLGTQVQSQFALQLAGRADNNIPNAQAQSIRQRLFGIQQADEQDPNQPPQAPQNPYDKLIDDILAQAKGDQNDRSDTEEQAPETEGPDERPLWQQFLESPDQAVVDAKVRARETALRISLGLVDEEGNVDYDTKLPSIDEESELGKLLSDLTYDLPRLETLAGQDENRINKLLTRGEQELKAERYIVAENIYRQILRETRGEPLAKAGLVHSQMGAGMIRSAAFNLRGLFADHPELIALRYDTDLMPQTDRLRWLQGRLQKMIGEDIHGADPGLVLAYLGYQLEAKPLIEFGLAVAESEAPRDPLMPVLRRIWLEAEGE